MWKTFTVVPDPRGTIAAVLDRTLGLKRYPTTTARNTTTCYNTHPKNTRKHNVLLPLSAAQALAADRGVRPHDADRHEGQAPPRVLEQGGGRRRRRGLGAEHDVSELGEDEAERRRAGVGDQEGTQEPSDIHRSR